MCEANWGIPKNNINNEHPALGGMCLNFYGKTWIWFYIWSQNISKRGNIFFPVNTHIVISSTQDKLFSWNM